LDSEPIDPTLGELRLASAVDDRTPHYLPEMGERHVLLHVKAANNALRSPLRWQVTDAGADRLLGVREPDLNPVELAIAALCVFGGKKRATQSLASRALDAGKAKDLAGVDRKVDILEGAAASEPPDHQPNH